MTHKQHPIQIVPLLCQLVFSMLILMALPPQQADAGQRTRGVCALPPLYGGYQLDCGGHLQAQCDSGRACDAGHNSYTDNVNFPIVADCLPNGIVPDESFSAGCYNRIPTCNDCGATGQPPCPAVAEPICGGCDDGYVENPITGLCQVPGDIGLTCSMTQGCNAGLLCDGNLLECVAPPASAGELCGGPFTCADGLQCSLALECVHEPAREGETCDVTAPCGDGLYCALGIPQRCVAFRKPGESCTPNSPALRCMSGSTCSSVPVPDADAPYACYPDILAGNISPAQCEDFFSLQVSQRVKDAAQFTQTWSAGAGVVGVAGLSTGVGVAYGTDGGYGCTATVCTGYEIDASVETWLSKGLYNGFDLLPGPSEMVINEFQVPGSVLNLTLGAIGAGPDLIEIGRETGWAIGLGLSPLPFSVGAYDCDTALHVVHEPDIAPAPPPPVIPPAPPSVATIPMGAIRFNGTSFLSAADANALQIDTGVTIETWLRSLGSAQTGTLLELSGQYRLALDNNELMLHIATTGSAMASPIPTGIDVFADQRWHHVAVSIDQTEAVVTVDGRDAFTWPLPGIIVNETPGGDVFSVGNGTTNNGFDGFLDSVRIWRGVRSRSDILATMNANTLPDISTLLASWHFDEFEDPSQHTNLAGPALVLTQGDPGLDVERAPHGRQTLGVAMNFDGVNDHISSGPQTPDSALVATDAITLEAWVFPRGPGGDPTWGGIIVNKEGEYSLGRRADGRLYFAINATSPGWVSRISQQIPLEEWTHVAVTYATSAQMAAVYFNGTLVDAFAYSGPIGDRFPERTELRIGGRQSDDLRDSELSAFDGLIDEVRVWTVRRTQAQIQSAYAQVLDPDTLPGLVGYWRFDEIDVDTAFDATGQYHASLGSGRTFQMPVRVGTRDFQSYSDNLLQVHCAATGCPADLDGDRIADALDNCTLAPNPTQQDADADGFGNICDPDFNNDGTVNVQDLGILRSNFFSNDPLTDINGDGTVNVQDLGLLRQTFFGTPGPSAFQ